MVSIATAGRGPLHATDWSLRESTYARKRQANDYMRHGLRRLDPDEAIPFFCECDDPECFTAVWLTGPAYDQLRRTAPARALNPTHSA